MSEIRLKIPKIKLPKINWELTWIVLSVTAKGAVTIGLIYCLFTGKLSGIGIFGLFILGGFLKDMFGFEGKDD